MKKFFEVMAQDLNSESFSAKEIIFGSLVLPCIIIAAVMVAEIIASL